MSGPIPTPIPGETSYINVSHDYSDSKKSSVGKFQSSTEMLKNFLGGKPTSIVIS